MRKRLLSIVAVALLATMNSFATQIEVTMNAKSKLIKSFVNKTTEELISVGEPASGNKYTFDCPDGTYLLTATAGDDGETISGTIELTVDASHTAFSIFSPEVRVKNADWVYGTDYTMSLRVTDNLGQEVNTTLGSYTSGNKMFMVFNGEVGTLHRVTDRQIVPVNVAKFDGEFFSVAGQLFKGTFDAEKFELTFVKADASDIGKTPTAEKKSMII